MAQFTEPKSFSTLKNMIAQINSSGHTDGYAVPNRFEVLITPPALLATKYHTQPQVVSLRCESISMPGRNLNTTTDSNIYGPTREIVDGVTYAEDISMVFQASSGLGERVFFEEWQKLAFDESTWNIGYYNDYVSIIDVYILDRKDQRTFGLKLWECFPKTITGTELNHATNNEIIKTSISFSFRYWETKDVERQMVYGESYGNAYDGTAVTRNIARNQPAIIAL